MTATVRPPASLRERLAATPIYLVATCPAAQVEPVLRRVAAAAQALMVATGAVAVQWRCKGESTDAVREVVARARGALPEGTLILVNDDLDAVFSARGRPLADGVHLGRQDATALAPAEVEGEARLAAGLQAARRRLGPELLLGTSVRTREELVVALAGGADHAGFGAMAPSGTKADTQLASPEVLLRLLREFPRVPLFPIGGLQPGNLRLAAGARRAAIGAAVLAAPDPAAAAFECLQALRAP